MTPVPSADPLAATASSAGITLTVRPSSTTVSVGKAVDFELVLASTRDDSIVYETRGCFARVNVAAPLVQGPGGRTWSGKAGAYKAQALEQTVDGGGWASIGHVLVDLQPDVCDVPATTVSWLDPGESVISRFRWNGRFGGDLPSRPGLARFEATVLIENVEPRPPNLDYSLLIASGMVTVTGGRAGYITAGEAIDAALSDERFAHFVEVQPTGTCAIANVYLVTWPEGVYSPPGPSWNVELLCDTGVPRHRARVSVDPVTAVVKGIDFCRVPCSR